MFTPVVPFDAADPAVEAALAEAADPLVSHAYVYLSLVATLPPGEMYPRANIPTVEFPVAEPVSFFAEAHAPDAFVSQAYVYLSLVERSPPTPE